ncbi:TetR/AcrR family transcriptional regulator [Thioclava sp. GXIMD4216]|uniref:TetR/AcrR family transcriptional regulator n=1 Tax=Thioclava litoralis TaxID=3076557 RepID=A0ABZ1E5M6_9RHOB|nr:TetR/AcrR family transcriptional regulator [Thioclava sp. FTW29]
MAEMTHAEQKPEMPEKARVVLAAAREVFLTHGFAAATTDMIQQRAGVSKSTVYSYFPGKEALFEAVLQTECSAHMSRLEGLPSERDDLRMSLHRVSVAYLDLILAPSSLALHRAAVAETVRFPEISRIFFQSGPLTFQTLIEALLTRATERGELALSADKVARLAPLYAGMLRGDWQVRLLTQSPPETPSHEALVAWVDFVLDTLFRGIAPQVS